MAKTVAVTLFLAFINLSASLNIGVIHVPRRSMLVSMAEVSSWPGDRPPVSNPNFLKQRMDAAWGRGKFRSEVWEDDVNPLNDWWLAYEPSQEEVEAAGKGFDFSDIEGWCKANNIDFEKASAALAVAHEKLNSQVVDSDATDNVEDFVAVQERYFKLLDKSFLRTLLVEDELNQAAKGQPSLLNDNTGYQFKNDP